VFVARYDQGGPPALGRLLDDAEEVPREATKKPQDFPLTDAGNAEAFVYLHGADWRYDHRQRHWLHWDENVWREDIADELHAAALLTARQRLRWAADLSDEETCRSAAKWALGSESRRRLDDMVALARSMEPVRDTGEGWDESPMLLAVENGTIDLSTGQLREGRRKDKLRICAPVHYNPEATCPLFETFLAQIMDGDQELVEYLQRVFGYCLTGDISEQALFILWGAGANGKTTLTEVIRGVLGDYAAQAPPELFLARRHVDVEAASPERARLVSKRVVFSAELTGGRTLDEALVKQITGGEPLSARYLYGNTFEFHPVFKPFLITNHRPAIRGTDYAIWRRVSLVPFVVQIPPARQDRHLGAKLLKEASGILAWMVRGCLEWQRRGGLEPPETVQAAVREYRESEDVLGRFLADRCSVGATYSVAAADLYRELRDWAEEAGERVPTQRQLGEYLAQQGYKSGKKGHKRQRRWFGLGLLSEDEERLDLGSESQEEIADVSEGTGS